MKIDLKKAYDSVEWSFIKEMLCALRFPSQFIELVMECVTTPTYSLALNGQQFGFFQGKRGLRQGDPMSPLLFTIAMEYLSRVHTVMADFPEFKFHPLCRQMRLTHLCFDDDLLMFSRGDTESVMLLLRAFETFSLTSGLQMNRDKSQLFFNGVQGVIKQQLLHLTGMIQGSLPFKYLGVSISPRKLSKLDCEVLVEKMVSRIRSWGARKLSYAGRLVLVKAVLVHVHSYWASIFIIPCGVLTKLTSICRAYLWEGREDGTKAPNVAWADICKDQKETGLGILNTKNQNKALLGKFVWWLASKEDHLWIRWIHCTYLKHSTWWGHEPTANCSWAWRMICKVRDRLAPAYVANWWLKPGGCYSVKEGYKWLQGDAALVPWRPLVWNRVATPKHSFVGWLFVNGRLATRDRLHRWGFCQDTICCLCSVQDEDHGHLFFQCNYSMACCDGVSRRIGVRIPCRDVAEWWLRKSYLTGQENGGRGCCAWFSVCAMEGTEQSTTGILCSSSSDCGRHGD